MEKGKGTQERAEGVESSAPGNTAFKVLYTSADVNKCRYSECPVQADSQCAHNKLKSSKQNMENMPAGEVPPQEDVPGFTALRAATCQGFDSNRQCIFGICEVWNEYGLKDSDPNNHSCHNGRAT